MIDFAIKKVKQEIRENLLNGLSNCPEIARWPHAQVVDDLRDCCAPMEAVPKELILEVIGEMPEFEKPEPY